MLLMASAILWVSYAQTCPVTPSLFASPNTIELKDGIVVVMQGLTSLEIHFKKDVSLDVFISNEESEIVYSSFLENENYAFIDTSSWEKGIYKISIPALGFVKKITI